MNDYPYSSIHEILETYLIQNFTEDILRDIVNECGRFLYHKKDIDLSIVEKLSMEFLVSNDYSKVEIFGGNLMSTLWIINLFPDNPEKYLTSNECIIQDKKYIYNPSKKTLKITKCRKKK